MSTRPSLAWILSVVVLLAAAVVGVVAWIYGLYYLNMFNEEWLPVPEHIHWVLWFGILCMILGGLGALTMLVMRHRRVAHA